VLYLYPELDPTGAYSFSETLCERLDCWRRRGHQVVMRTVGTMQEAFNVLSEFPDRSVHHFILGGHGSATKMLVGNGWDGKFEALDPRAAELLRRLRRKLSRSRARSQERLGRAEVLLLLPSPLLPVLLGVRRVLVDVGGLGGGGGRCGRRLLV